MKNHILQDVLIIENNIAEAIRLKRLLGSLGYNFEHVMYRRDALKCFAHKAYTFILLDICYKGHVSPDEAARRIRAIEMQESRHRCPIIATAGNINPEIISPYRNAGINVMVKKPLYRESLMPVLMLLLPGMKAD